MTLCDFLYLINLFFYIILGFGVTSGLSEAVAPKMHNLVCLNIIWPDIGIMEGSKYKVVALRVLCCPRCGHLILP